MGRFDDFEIIGTMSRAETFAVGASIREIERLREQYGAGRWRKRKGYATVKLKDGTIVQEAEIHWYEAHGIGRVDDKIKRVIRW